MNISLNKTNNMVELTWGNIEARISAFEVKFGQFGCKVLRRLFKNISDFPPGLLELWDNKFGRSGWRNVKNTRERLAKAIYEGVKHSGLDGVSLWDTMRKGSDYWRPGGLLKEVAEWLSAQKITVTYDREDELCPSSRLFDYYMDPECPLNHTDFAVEYASQLKNNGMLPVAAAKIILYLSRGILPALYCIDEYIPGYGLVSEQMEGIPYKERTWLFKDYPVLRNYGCHRFVLAEEIARFFNNKGIGVDVYEIDPTFMNTKKRNFAAAQQKKSSGASSKRQWDEDSFFKSLENRINVEELDAAKKLYGSFKARADRISWGSGTQSGSCTFVIENEGVEHFPFVFWTYGKVEIQLQSMKEKPPFQEKNLRKKLLTRLNKIKGVDFSEDAIDKRPGISFSLLKDDSAMKQCIDLFDWVISYIKESWYKRPRKRPKELYEITDKDLDDVIATLLFSAAFDREPHGATFKNELKKFTDEKNRRKNK